MVRLFVMACLPESLQGDKELALIAMNSPENRYAFEHLPISLQSDAKIKKALAKAARRQEGGFSGTNLKILVL